jgi:protein-disulfide isomerase
MQRPARLTRLFTTALVAAACLAPLSLANAQQSAPDKPAIEQIVKDYLLAHPEVIVQSLNAFQQKQEAAEAEAQRSALVSRQDELFKNPASPIVGNPKGDVTLVEFFDYHCPYCKAVAAPLQKLLKDDKGVRLVMKEFPILGEDSVLASHAALAAAGQGKYWEFHQALMEHRGQFDMDVIKTIAAKVGLDPAKLEADMGQQKIEPQISANHKLAQTLDISATPTFIIGDQVVEGAVPLEQLKELIQKARRS